MEKCTVNGTLRLLTNNTSNGILAFSEETLQMLSLTHQEAQQNRSDKKTNTQYCLC